MKRNVGELRQITRAFAKELSASNRGEKTSLAFIRHTLPQIAVVHDNEEFEAIVIGGSVYKSALLVKQGGSLHIKKATEGTQPPFATVKDFLSFIAALIDTRVHIVGLNFAYPLKPVFENGKLDGVFIAGGKEHIFEGLPGKKVGKEIEDFAGRKLRISVANDTICLLLSGLTQVSWDYLAAGIVGTGMNFALFMDASTAVNLEAAGFNKFPQSDKGKIIDKQSVHPSRALFEKEVSGAYLYQHYDKTIQSTEQLDQLARNGNVSAQKLFEYSAALIACQIAGITLFKKHDMTFVMEGSLFWKGWQYKETVKTYTGLLAPGYKVSFVSIADSAVMGAAKLVS